MKVWRPILDLLFPQSCLYCKRSGEFLCFACISNFQKYRENGEIVSLFSYSDPKVKHALWLLKYHEKRGVAENLGRALYERILEDYADMKLFHASLSPLVVPIPITRARGRRRGFNQSELLTRAILAADHEKQLRNGAGILKKIRNTLPQAKIKNRSERLKNVVGVFETTRGLAGETIFLIDDITTTGATLKDARRALKKVGAKEVLCFTVAH